MAGLYDGLELAPVTPASAPPAPRAPASMYQGLEVVAERAIEARPASGLVEHAQAGFQASAIGLGWRQKLPELVMDPETSKWWERLATGVSMVAMDLPIMIPAGAKGAAVGAVAGGAVAGPIGAAVGAPLVGGAAMFAAPAAIRESLIQAYKARDAETPADWFNIVRAVATATAHEGAVGAVTMGAGAVAARVAGNVLAPVVGTSMKGTTAVKAAGVADVAAQIAAMTTMPAAMEGRLPEMREFADAAAVILTLKAGHVVVDRALRARTTQRVVDAYLKTGRTPAEQVADAQADPRMAEEFTRAPVDPITMTTSGVPVKLDRIIAEAEFLARGGVPEAPNIKEIIREIKAAGPLQADMITDIERIGALHDQARQAPLTNPERAELESLRERFKSAGEAAAEQSAEPPAGYSAIQTTEAQARAAARIAELSAKTEALTDTERAERVFLTNAKPEAMARHFKIEPVVITREAREASAQRVHDDVLRQVREADQAREAAGLAKLGDDHAAAVAALVRARVRTRAARLEVLPEEIYNERPLQIRDETAAEVAAAEAAIPPEAARFIPPEVDLFGAPIDVPNVPRFAVENLATQEVPLSSLVLSKEVPQFKGAANELGVIVPLGGRFDRTGVGPIQVWERTDGTLEVISGRHRLDLARRTGETTIPAQIHREAEGFSARQAATLDAQLNIREEQGSVADYAQYFKDAGISQEAANELGLLARAKGRAGYAIARDASPDLIAAHRAGLLSDEAALAVSLAAPGSERLQAVGVVMVQEGKSILIAVNTMKAVDLMAADRIAAGAQGDIFGFDDSAMQEAQAMAKRASARQRKIGEQIAAVSGASRRPELAARMGVDVKDPEAIRLKIVELKQEQVLWDNWPMHPELVKILRTTEASTLKQQAAPLGIEPDPIITDSGSAPTRPPGERWESDRGAQAQDPILYLDVKKGSDDFDSAKAAIMEREILGRGFLFDVVDRKGNTRGTFQTVDEAVAAAERIFPEGKTLKQGPADVKSPAFREWFGESKVVDADGKPLRVYHGSSEGGGEAFEVFQGNQLAGWFTKSPSLAGRYADNRDKGEYDATIYPAYLSIKNPLDLTFDKRFDLTNSEATAKELFERFGLSTPNKALLLDGEGLYESVNHRDFVEAARNAGYDGIKALEEGYVTWGAFSSRQIKSAIGNRGTYDPNDPNILRQDAFELKPETPAELAARNLEAAEAAKRKLDQERAEASGAQGKKVSVDQPDLFATQRALFQEHRASYQVAENLIKIMQGADKSSVVHELGHSWLEEMKADAARPNAPEQIKADWEIIRRELAIGEGAEITRTSHEQFARSVERYLAEGEAPSRELQGVFARFREWLIEIYKSLANLNVTVNPELKVVLDRMLATDQEIADARELNVPRAYVAEARANEARKIVPGFKAEQISMEPYADSLPKGPGEAPDNSHVNYAFINSPLDVKMTMQRMAEIDQANIQKQRGGTDGVKSWKEANAEQAKYVNDILGGTEDTLRLLSPRDPDAAGPDVRLGILKKLAVGAAKDSARLRDVVLEAGHDATVREQLEYMGSIERARMIQAEFLGERASVARAMNALKDVTEGSGEIGRMLDAIGYGEEAAATLYQAARTPAQEQAVLRAKLDEILQNYRGKSVLDIARLHKEIGTLKGTFKFSKEIEKATTWEMVVEAWKSSLLSGPVTHTTNVGGTLSFQFMRPAVDALAATIGMARGASVGMGESDRASMSEAVARVSGMLGGIQDGLKVAYHTFRLDDPTGKTESYRTAIPGRAGEIIRIPLRLMGAGDALTTTMYRRGEMRTLAIRQAFDENGNPGTQEFARRVDELMERPTPEMEAAADAASTRMSFNAPLGEKGVSLQLFVNKWNLQWMIPFIRTPINIAKEVGRMSPIAPLVGEWRADFSKGGVARDRALAEVAIGTAIMGVTMAYAFSGDITGGGSPDPGKNRGKAGVTQPYSWKIGDTLYEYARLQPMGTLVGLAADLANVWDHATEEEKDKIPKMLAVAFSNAVTNQTFLQGITNFVNATSDPTRFGPRFFQQFAGSMVPNIIGQPTAMADPVVREVNSALEAILARLPGFRQDLIPKRDWLGAPVETKERLGVVSPVRMLKVTEDKVRLEAARLDISMAAPPKKTHIGKGTGKLGDVKLTPEEQDTFEKVGGEMAHRILGNIVNAPGYDGMPDLVKRRIFSKVLSASHRVAAIQALPMEKRIAYLQGISQKMAAELVPGDAQ